MTFLKNKKIAIFMPSFGNGGVERVMVTLANAFVERGYSVDLVVALDEGPTRLALVSKVRIVDLKSARAVRALFPLIRYLKKEKPHAMLSAMNYVNVIAILARMLSRVSTRLVVSERSTISLGEKSIRSINGKLALKLVPWLYPKADGICTVSKEASRDLSEFANLPEKKIETIYNPFDLELLNKKAQEMIEHPWFAVRQCPVILAIGRLAEEKGFFFLLEAFAMLRKTRQVRLLILGEGELKKQIEQHILKLDLSKEDVQLQGYTMNPFPYFKKCDLFVLSSKWEGLPGVLIEAMVCGAPVVSTNCLSGPSEILENGKWGKLVPIDDHEALAKAMADTLSAPREQLPDVRVRAKDFALEPSVNAYLKILGLG